MTIICRIFKNNSCKEQISASNNQYAKMSLGLTEDLVKCHISVSRVKATLTFSLGTL